MNERTKSKPINPATLVIKPQRARIPQYDFKDSTDGLFARLRLLREQCGPTANEHDLAYILINACIEEGINTKAHMNGVLRHLDLSRGFIAITLKQGTGSNPESFAWRCVEGVYSSHDA